MADVSISYKGNEIASMNESGAKTLLTGSCFCEGDITVAYTKPSGGPVEKKQINFIDYDGTLLYSYTKAEINDMASESDLPANPSHTGLTAQGWNWTLAQIKSQLTDAPDGDVWVGQMYITSDGKTRIYIRLEDGRLSPELGIGVNGTALIEWGDGTTDTVTGNDLDLVITTQHAYSSSGYYTISISVTGEICFVGDNNSTKLLSGVSSSSRVYQNSILCVEIGNGIETIGSSAFYNCYSLAVITLPNTVTSIKGTAFNNCYSLIGAVVPNSVTDIQGSTFYYCYSLCRVSIPCSVATIPFNMFANCFSLTSITIPKTVTSIKGSVVAACYSLRTVIIPNDVAALENSLFSSCYSLCSITIPNGVTSIGNEVFRNCRSISKITIPGSVTSIGNSAFASCYGLKECHIQAITVPTGGTGMFNNASTDFIIYVPAESLNDYQTASNWSTYASYMQGE